MSQISPPGTLESHSWVPVCLVFWLCRPGLLSHLTTLTLTLCGGGGEWGREGKPWSALSSFQSVRSSRKGCSEGYQLSSAGSWDITFPLFIYTLDILALCCLVSYSSTIPEPCAMFIKIEHKSMSYSQCWSPTGASFF